jgi:hypothetical protein
MIAVLYTIFLYIAGSMQERNLKKSTRPLLLANDADKICNHCGVSTTEMEISEMSPGHESLDEEHFLELGEGRVDATRAVTNRKVEGIEEALERGYRRKDFGEISYREETNYLIHC